MNLNDISQWFELCNDISTLLQLLKSEALKFVIILIESNVLSVFFTPSMNISLRADIFFGIFKERKKIIWKIWGFIARLALWKWILLMNEDSNCSHLNFYDWNLSENSRKAHVKLNLEDGNFLLKILSGFRNFTFIIDFLESYVINKLSPFVSLKISRILKKLWRN